MIFTHRKHNIKEFHFGDQILNVQREVKWLGLLLDPKLTFKNHLARVKQKGMQTISQLSRLSKTTWGLGCKEARTLITTI